MPGRPEISEFGLLKSVGHDIGVEGRCPRLGRKLGPLSDMFKINLREKSEPLHLPELKRLLICLRKAMRKKLESMEQLGVIG